MAASVMNTFGEFGLSRFLPKQEEMAVETEEEEEDDDYREEDTDESVQPIGSWSPYVRENLCEQVNVVKDPTSQLLCFAELISSDVQRYFGRSQEAIPGGEIKEDDNLHHSSGTLQQVVESKGLGPLAELFQEEQTKGRGLPMNQRRLPDSFWTEPQSIAGVTMRSNSKSCLPMTLLNDSADACNPLNILNNNMVPASLLNCHSISSSIRSNSTSQGCTLTSTNPQQCMLSANIPVSLPCNNPTSGSLLSNNSTSVSSLSGNNVPMNSAPVCFFSGNHTIDFSDLLAYWATEKESSSDHSHGHCGHY